ncbi:MAG: hypothetical protein JKY65_06955 [Planctomycetes bacterium]|nr:hypothetical protein [Planctomycetota bacterium]
MSQETPDQLRQRMLDGALPRERLQLADALGYAPAQQALERPDPPPPGAWDPPTGPITLEFWGRRLGRFGPAVMFRIATALARYSATQTEPHPALEEGLSVADRFLARAEGASGEGLAEATETAAKSVARAALTLEGSPEGQACRTLLPVLRAILAVLEGGPPDRALLDSHYLRTLEQASAADLSLDAVQAAIRVEVCAWALG